MFEKIKKIIIEALMFFLFIAFVLLMIISAGALIFITFFKPYLDGREKKVDWEQTQIAYQCELKEVNASTNLNLYTCKNRKDDTNIFNIENSYDLSVSDKAKLKKQCKIISVSKMKKIGLLEDEIERDLYELSCDNEKIKVLTNNLNDFLAK